MHSKHIVDLYSLCLTTLQLTLPLSSVAESRARAQTSIHSLHPRYKCLQQPDTYIVSLKHKHTHSQDIYLGSILFFKCILFLNNLFLTCRLLCCFKVAMSEELFVLFCDVKAKNTSANNFLLWWDVCKCESTAIKWPNRMFLINFKMRELMCTIVHINTNAWSCDVSLMGLLDC